MKILSDLELEELKHIELDMLVSIDTLCRKNEIKYSMAAGTLLGGARHKGFIPWDDDIDIMLMREEYEKLKKCIEQCHSDLYWVDYHKYEGYPYPFSKIMKKGTMLKEESNKYATAPDGVFIDVFPIDYSTENDKKRKKQYDSITRWKQRLVTRQNYYFGQTGIREWYRIVRKEAMKLIPREWFVNKMDAECHRYSNTNTLISLTGTVGYEKATYPREWFESYIDLEFEGVKLMAIEKYKDLLKKQYGDYMRLPPENERIPHHYVNELKL